jgi:hypothetical protein
VDGNTNVIRERFRMNPDYVESPKAEYVVTCVTVGCENENIPINAIAAVEGPIFQCGPCGNLIAYIV